MFYYAVINDMTGEVLSVEANTHRIESPNHIQLPEMWGVQGKIYRKGSGGVALQDFRNKPSVSLTFNKSVVLKGTPVELKVSYQDLLNDVYLEIYRRHAEGLLFRTIKKDEPSPYSETMIFNEEGVWVVDLIDPSGFARGMVSLIVHGG